ncbi:MAG: hypothetical protein C5B60_00255 [Chloroflexi bacterium]|nr:MAG: hypothetical protein C5B60_00255 [Chloroflexota bacterium]
MSEIHVPTLILHGKGDTTAPYKLAETMHAGISGSKLVTFNGGHLFFLFRAQQFVAAIVDFMNT